MYVNKAVRLNPRIISNAVGMSNFLKKKINKKQKRKSPTKKPPENRNKETKQNYIE